MKKIYTLSFALLLAGALVAQNTMVKKVRTLEESNYSITTKGANNTTSNNNQSNQFVRH